MLHVFRDKDKKKKLGSIEIYEKKGRRGREEIKTN